MSKKEKNSIYNKNRYIMQKLTKSLEQAHFDTDMHDTRQILDGIVRGRGIDYVMSIDGVDNNKEFDEEVKATIPARHILFVRTQYNTIQLAITNLIRYLNE
jgi:hypothetical protein